MITGKVHPFPEIHRHPILLSLPLDDGLRLVNVLRLTDCAVITSRCTEHHIINDMSETSRPHRPRWIILVAVAALAAVTACTSSGSSTGAKGTRPSAATSATETGQPASAVLASALAALRAGPSVHLQGVIKSSSHVGELSQNSGADAGRQVWTIDGNEHAAVLVVGGVGYIKGNAAALTGFFGFPAALATRLVGRWISFHPGDSAGGTNYQAVTSGVTLASVADELRLTGPITLTAPTVAAGQPVVGVHGHAPVGHDNPPGSTLTLYVASRGHPLPVTFQTKAAVGQATYRFSRWGEALHLTAPPNPIPAASLSSPGQG